jgi:ribonuclease HI
MEIDIYTDGGCSGNPGPGGWAYVVLAKSGDSAAGGAVSGILGDRAQNKACLKDCSGDRADTVLLQKWGAEPNTTNNRMELGAALAALQAVQTDLKCKPDKIRIFTDSQYLQKGISQWLKAWKRNGWRTSGKEPVKNRDLWEKLDILNISMPVEWRWVKGHDGNVYNELCDQMTQEAIASLRCGASQNGI